MANNPTITEHDFRFPRRPFESTAGGQEVKDEGSPGDLRIRELNLDMAAMDNVNAVRHDLLKTSLFPHLENGMADSNQTTGELQAQDPLAMQVWKFFSKTKQSLPRQERMENLTWRMMYANLRKWRKQQAQHDERIPVHGESCRPPISTSSTATTVMADSSSSARHNSNAGTANAPSGIAQLRKATDQNVSQPEPMNLDDFIFPDNVSPSAGFTSSLETGKQEKDKSATRATAAAIPIKSRKASGQHFVPQSVPAPPHQRTQDEFGYVTRHHRKTSIDERRVSAGLVFSIHSLMIFPADASLNWPVIRFHHGRQKLLRAYPTNHLSGPEPQASCKFISACVCSK